MMSERRLWKFQVSSFKFQVRLLGGRSRGCAWNLELGTWNLGFTLVELLVVIAIIGILISLVTAGAQAARRRAAVSKAKTTIAALEAAVAMYQGDMGEYPESGNQSLVGALQDDPHDADWQGPYMEFKRDDLDEEGNLIDPWGNPYEFISVNGGAPEHRPRSYDLFSFGPNGQDDGGAVDDLCNW